MAVMMHRHYKLKRISVSCVICRRITSFQSLSQHLSYLYVCSQLVTNVL